MNIADHVENARRHHPDRLALVFEGQSFTYAALDEQANRLANALRAVGIGRGDRVALYLPNIPEFVTSYLGIQKLGAISVAFNPALQSSEVEFILTDSGASVLITTEELRANVPTRRPPRLEHLVIADGTGPDSLRELVRGVSANATAVRMRPDEPAAVLYTSGTTGLPKGALMSHDNVMSNVLTEVSWLGLGPEDRILLSVPASHCYGQNAVLNSALTAGATLFLHRRFQAETIIQAIRDDQITVFFGSPTSYIAMYERASVQDFASIRCLVSGGAPLPIDLQRKWQERFKVRISQGYGMTEVQYVSLSHGSTYKEGSVGKPLDGVEVRLVDLESGREVPTGEPGHILLRGPNVPLGYWKREEETALAIQEGWFHTGDVGRFDAEGYLFISDRLKDMIKVGGLSAFPAEIERALAQHAAVADLAVYGLPEPLMGEQVVASIVRKPGQVVSGEELAAWCRERLASYKVPSTIEFVDEIPKSPAGKILRRLLQQKKTSAAAGSAKAASQDSLQRWLVDWLSRRLSQQQARQGQPPLELDVNASLRASGLDSLIAVELRNRLQSEFNIEVPAVTLLDDISIAALAENLSRQNPRPEQTSGAERRWMEGEV
jgi:long-chain acyl-CoA synthetase